MGNHEFENYWFGCGQCSGFQAKCYDAYHNFFDENAKHFKMAVEYDGWVFSHAGFTKTWVEETSKIYSSRIANFEFSDKPVEMANALLQTGNVRFFHYSDWDFTGYGDNVHQGPLWVRPSALLKDFYFDKQVVGHTETRSGKPMYIKNRGLNVILADTQSHSSYLILDTENPPEFFSLEDAARQSKLAEKAEQRLKSEAGEKKKKLREKYNLTKSVVNRLSLYAESEVNAAAEHNIKMDFWEYLEELCKKEVENGISR